MAAAVASGLAKSAFSHAASTVSPTIASRQPKAEPGMNARVASSKPRASSARCAAARSRRAKWSRAHHPAKARISTRIATDTVARSPRPRTRASAQASTRTAAMATTAHTGSDTMPVKSRAVSPARSSMSHYSREQYGSMRAAVTTPAGLLRTRERWRKRRFPTFAECVPARNGGANSAGKFELAFPGHALEHLIRIFDAILVIGAVGGEQLHHLIGTVGDHVTNRTRREVDALADLKLVFLQQRGSPALERYGLLVLSGVPPIAAEYSSQI